MEYIKAKHIVIKGSGDSWFGEEYNMNIYKAAATDVYIIYCDSRNFVSDALFDL